METMSTTAVVTGMLATAIITGFGICIGYHVGLAFISGTKRVLTAGGNAMSGKANPGALDAVKELTEQIKALNNGSKTQQTSPAAA